MKFLSLVLTMRNDTELKPIIRILMELYQLSFQVFSVQSMSPTAGVVTGPQAPATSEAGENLPRVLVVTSTKLLSLLAISRQGSVDGTFASMSKLWKQLFMFLGNLDSNHIPICWGYLPDKTFRLMNKSLKFIQSLTSLFY